MSGIKYTLWTASFLLLCSAGLHAVGFAEVNRLTNNEGLDSFIRVFMPPVWLFSTANWLVVAFVVVIISINMSRSNAYILFVTSLLPIADAVLIFIFIGSFIGGFALLLSGALMALCALLSLRAGSKNLSHPQ